MHLTTGMSGNKAIILGASDLLVRFQNMTGLLKWPELTQYSPLTAEITPRNVNESSTNIRAKGIFLVRIQKRNKQRTARKEWEVYENLCGGYG